MLCAVSIPTKSQACGHATASDPAGSGSSHADLLWQVEGLRTQQASELLLLLCCC